VIDNEIKQWQHSIPVPPTARSIPES